MVMKCCPPGTRLEQDVFSKEWLCVAGGTSGVFDDAMKTPIGSFLIAAAAGAIGLAGVYFVVTGLAGR